MRHRPIPAEVTDLLNELDAVQLEEEQLETYAARYAFDRAYDRPAHLPDTWAEARGDV